MLVRGGDTVAAVKLVTDVQQSFGLPVNVSQFNHLLRELLSLEEVEDCVEVSFKPTSAKKNYHRLK